MALKRYKPVTSSQRGLVNIDRSELWKGRPVKALVCGKNKKSGHNNDGQISSWHRGGGHKQLYRIIDFKRDRLDQTAVVERIEYDPNRSSFIALLKYSDGHLTYIIAPNKLKVGDEVIAGEKTDIKPGNCMRLKNFPLGTAIHNIELKIGKGAQLVRSAGCYAQIMGRDGQNAIIKMASGEVRLINSECFATVGVVSNADHSNRTYAKAGRKRWMGRRPIVRGVVMNPVDHPHGGGEGRTSGGRHPVTPWGVKTKGKRTRNNKRTSNMIVRRRKTGK